LEPRSNTMKMGVHENTLLASLEQADDAYLFEPDGLDWSLQAQAKAAGRSCDNQVDTIIEKVCKKAKAGQHILIMSNGGFAGIHQKLVAALEAKFA